MTQTLHSHDQTLRKNISQLLAWVFAASIPFISYFLLININSETYSLNHQQALFLSMVSSAVVMWALRLVPDFVPGLSLLIMVTLLDLVPQSIAFSGFVSEIFFLVLGVFVLAGLLAESNWLPFLESVAFNKGSSLLVRGVAIIGLGITLTLIVPSPLGRSSMVYPLLNRFLGPTTKKTNTLLSLIHIHAATLFSTVFLTGNPLNFVLLSMLEQQTQNRFQWLGWLKAGSVTCLVLAIGIMVFFFLGSRLASTEVSYESESKEQDVNLKSKDWGAAILYGFMFLAVLTRSVHQLPLVWLIMALALTVFYFSGMTLVSLRQRVDWPTLIFIATVVAWGPILDFLELNQWLAKLAVFLVPLFESGIALGILGTAALIFVVRLFIPGAPAFLLLASTLIPFAMNQQGITISPWLIGFIIVTLSEGFIFSYQHGVPSQVLSDLDSDKIPFNLRTFLASNLFFWLVRLTAILASIPLWHSMKLV